MLHQKRISKPLGFTKIASFVLFMKTFIDYTDLLQEFGNYKSGTGYEKNINMPTQTMLKKQKRI